VCVLELLRPSSASFCRANRKDLERLKIVMQSVARTGLLERSCAVLAVPLHNHQSMTEIGLVVVTCPIKVSGALPSTRN
jgi:hypothetical protein